MLIGDVFGGEGYVVVARFDGEVCPRRARGGDIREAFDVRQVGDVNVRPGGGGARAGGRDERGDGRSFPGSESG